MIASSCSAARWCGHSGGRGCRRSGRTAVASRRGRGNRRCPERVALDPPDGAVTGHPGGGPGDPDRRRIGADPVWQGLQRRRLLFPKHVGRSRGSGVGAPDATPVSSTTSVHCEDASRSATTGDRVLQRPWRKRSVHGSRSPLRCVPPARPTSRARAGRPWTRSPEHAAGARGTWLIARRARGGAGPRARPSRTRRLLLARRGRASTRPCRRHAARGSGTPRRPRRSRPAPRRRAAASCSPST